MICVFILNTINLYFWNYIHFITNPKIKYWTDNLAHFLPSHLEGPMSAGSGLHMEAVWVSVGTGEERRKDGTRDRELKI